MSIYYTCIKAIPLELYGPVFSLAFSVIFLFIFALVFALKETILINRAKRCIKDYKYGVNRYYKNLYGF